MIHIMLRLGTVLGAMLIGFIANGQQFDSALRFEVASVKPTEKMGPCTIGPGITQFSCKGTANSMMVFAFHLSAYQYSFSMLDGPKYEVIAKVPPAVSEEISKGARDGHEVAMAMLQDLLIKRFKLSYHYQKKQLDEYSLVVGKNGHKLTVSPPESLPTDDPSAPVPAAKKDRYDSVAPRVIRGEVTYERDVYGTVHLLSTGATIDQFAAVAKTFLSGLPVVDSTELSGRYDFVLTFNASSLQSVFKSGTDFHAPDIRSAVEHQLGLRLVKKRAKLDMFVVDHLEKPAVN